MESNRSNSTSNYNQTFEEVGNIRKSQEKLIGQRKGRPKKDHVLLLRVATDSLVYRSVLSVSIGNKLWT